jgi:pimeloyl-ACP methyl ester carboxylesterase
VQNPRSYGKPPFRVAVLHGGPGAPGYMAPVARELAAERGVLEPLQTADSVEGQLDELHRLLVANAELPVILIGSSWGAMLGFLFAARWPECVAKLLMIGSGVFDPRYAASIQETRLARLGKEGRREALALTEALADPGARDKDEILAHLGRLWTKTDAYDPLTLDTEVIEHQYDLHVRVWSEAEQLRSSGQLLELGRRIQCPVVAIHGDHDPHPAEGVRQPLASVLRSFRFVLLEKCGHLPWIERQAKDAFYRVLKEEIWG